MSTLAARAAPPSRPAALAVFTAAIFLSAFLLFLVQPMFSRMVLPLLGGTPAVWNTCMLFFQAALLAGYLYAHASVRALPVTGQTGVHLALLAVAFLALPIAVGGEGPEGGAAPIPWLLLRMAATVGLPFFALSGTGPLLQRWFAHTGHPDAGNPYFLYAASNLGSMLALLGYPLFLEPRLRLAEQSAAWAAGYGLLILLVGACAVALRGSRRDLPVAEAPSPVEEASPVSWRERSFWVLLAFVPSSLFLSVTTLITTDIAPAPMFWVVPLAIYLLTLTLTFARRPPIPHVLMLRLQPSLVVAVAVLIFLGFSYNPMLLIPLHLALLFVTAMVCHGELARRRPPVRWLTEFYLWLSVGGVLGGIFNVLMAPAVFAHLVEYPVAVALACAVRPRPRGAETRSSRVLDWLLPLGFLAVLVPITRSSVFTAPAIDLKFAGTAALVAVVCVWFARSPVRLALGVGAVLLLGVLNDQRGGRVLLAERTFFGRYTVREVEDAGRFHSLVHGTTLHGAQSLDPAERREPLTYYRRGGPLGQVFASLPRRPERRVAVVGLGTGTSAAYGAPGERWTYFEIDPAVVRIARDPRLFTYLADSPSGIRVVLGDARLSLAEVPDRSYDLILLDAFSSDAIPIHLITREALGLYLAKLAPGGVLVFHLSNRYLELEPVLGALARERGLVARVGSADAADSRYGSASTWAVLARREEDLGTLLQDPRWVPLPVWPGLRPWTDDFSNLLGVLRF
ncbi:MAG TPA: fused MFS/spermidine synthase [Longimicrobiaceae bacterium]|nr:fused MFS/spermidine synthase [Longimicrobiaceae bacterium]